jgi:copper(I)-binding protein
LFLKLPAKTGPLYFPTVQQCEKGETRWTDIPAAGQAWRDVPHPAPVLQLTAASGPAPAMAGDIMINPVWSPATPGGATTAAVYATIMNHGSQADTLTGGSTPVAGKFEIHQTTRTNGVVSMRPISTGIPVPAGGMVTLGPQADYHVMLSGLKEPLKTGTRVPATLNFAKAGPVQVQITVEPIGARGPSAMPGMDHH